MGFKFKRIDLVAGSAEFPVNDSSYANVLARSKTILSRCAEAIIDCNCGWELDSTKSTSLTDYTMIDSRVTGEPYPALFLTNSDSGCKLFLSYFGNSASYGIKDFSGTGDDIFCVSNSTNRYSAGLCISIIPGDSSNTFGDPSTTSFLPNEATRIVGSINRSNYNASSHETLAYSPTSGYIYSWGLFVTDKVISLSCTVGTANPATFGVPVYAVGQVFGTLVHTNDYSKYGVIVFRSSGTNSGSGTEGRTSLINISTSLYGTSKYFVGRDPQTTTSASSYMNRDLCFGVIAKSDGTWINGTDESIYGVTLFPVNVSQLSGYVFNSTNNGKSRWCPYIVRCISSDLYTYGVEEYDGEKGYLDTDLFRCGFGVYGQQFDNGNFICLDGDSSFIIGWDPDNDPLVGLPELGPEPT